MKEIINVWGIANKKVYTLWSGYDNFDFKCFETRKFACEFAKTLPYPKEKEVVRLKIEIIRGGN